MYNSRITITLVAHCDNGCDVSGLKIGTNVDFSLSMNYDGHGQ